MRVQVLAVLEKVLVDRVFPMQSIGFAGHTGAIGMEKLSTQIALSSGANSWTLGAGS